MMILQIRDILFEIIIIYMPVSHHWDFTYKLQLQYIYLTALIFEDFVHFLKK